MELFLVEPKAAILRICHKSLLVILTSLGLVQTSNFSCAEPNANELKQRT